MKGLEYYEQLPDYMSVDQLDAEFREFLSNAERIQPDLAYVESLLALSERQWHTYELLVNDLRNRISLFLVDVWKDDDVEEADAILSITGMLGLPAVLDFLSSKATDSFSPDVRKSVKEAFDEFGSTISDPYKRC